MFFTILLLLLVVLILISGFLSATETAFFSLSPMKVRALDEGKDKRGRLIANLVSRPRELLVTILMMNVLVNILVQNVVSSIFGSLSGLFLTVGVPLGLTLVFGEVIPKSIAISNNLKISAFSAPIIRIIEKWLSPIRFVIIKITNGLARVMFFFLRKEKEISSEELKVALKATREYGFLSPDEALLIKGYLNLEEHLVKEIMKPRQEIISFDIDGDLQELKAAFVDKECSRIPVYKGSFENIIGVISSSTFFLYQDKIDRSSQIKPFLEEPFFIPETSEAKNLLNQLYEHGETMAIVVDEYGALSGLATMEDCIEVVVGQITDRRDDKVLFTRAGEDVIIASGKLELTTFEEIFDSSLESENNMATVGGYLTEQLGDIPKDGTKFVTDEFLFHVLSSDPKRVRRVYIRKLAKVSGKKPKVQNRL